ncbi:MAG: DsrE family protein [Betaproteobacteria bacterium]|nr:DsrE family protein [Betaproteobacteria bacterium]
MAQQTLLKSLIVSAALLGTLAGGHAAMAAPSGTQAHAIHVEIPVKLKEADVVFNMDHLAFFGDMPVGMKYMHLLALRMKKTRTPGKIIGVFHGKAAFMTLNDKAYDAYRGVTTGNPYKGLIANLQRQGVQIEECAVSMKGHGWGNADLLPGVLVNAGAVGRIIQLVQQGYVQIQP